MIQAVIFHVTLVVLARHVTLVCHLIFLVYHTNLMELVHLVAHINRVYRANQHPCPVDRTNIDNIDILTFWLQKKIMFLTPAYFIKFVF